MLASPAAVADTSTPHQNYSWVDKNGERHYGDAVPPEYAQQERRVLNSQGVEIQRVDAEKNAQQVAEDRKRQQAAEPARQILRDQQRTHRRSSRNRRVPAPHSPSGSNSMAATMAPPNSICSSAPAPCNA